MLRRSSIKKLLYTIALISLLFWLAADFLGDGSDCADGDSCSPSSYRPSSWRTRVQEFKNGQPATSDSSSKSSSFSSPKITIADDCSDFAGIEDVLVIFKTGATESLKKLPPHFNTTMTCLKNYVIYSDLHESIDGHEVLDSLDEVSPEITRSYPGFDMYNRLRAQGRDGLLPHEYTEGKGGAAWNLDKWKFLPIVDKVAQAWPGMKWYIYVEADTYVFWPNMLAWLAKFDHRQPYYIGNQMQIGEQVFGHGGAGFILSHAALRRATRRHQEHLAFYDDFTAQHWAGDCVLGKMMQDEDINLLWAWPLLQEHKASQLDPTSHGWDKRLWCYPAVTYHHVTGDEVRAFHAFERDWRARGRPPIRFKDVFEHHLRPQFAPELEGWDNLSADTELSEAKFRDDPKILDGLSQAERDAPGSFSHCRAACESQGQCLQFLYAYDEKRCALGRSLKLGNANATYPGGVKSGFLMDRVDALINGLEPCAAGSWILPPAST